MVNFPLQSSRANFCAYLKLIQFTFLIPSFNVKKKHFSCMLYNYLSIETVGNKSVNKKVILPLYQHLILLIILPLHQLYYPTFHFTKDFQLSTRILHVTCISLIWKITYKTILNWTLKKCNVLMFILLNWIKEPSVFYIS